MHRLTHLDMGVLAKTLMLASPGTHNITVWERFHDFMVFAVDYLDKRLSSHTGILVLHQLVTHVCVGFAGYCSKDEISITAYEVLRLLNNVLCFLCM